MLCDALKTSGINIVATRKEMRVIEPGLVPLQRLHTRRVLYKERIMGTRCTIQFSSVDKDNSVNTYVTIYQQFDGYPEGVGLALAEWLKSKTMINGIGEGQWTSKYANGIDCLVAQFIRDFKHEVGDLYIDLPSSATSKFIDYHYEVEIANRYDLPRDGMPIDEMTIIRVTCWDMIDKPIFAGNPSEFIRWVEELEKE